MIYQVVVFFVVLILAAFANYAFGYVFAEVYSWLATTYPDIINISFFQFFVQLNTWKILIIVLIPITIWFFVNIQKPRG